MDQIHWRLTRPTQLQRPDGHYEPYIHCNITSLPDDMFGRKQIQVSYELADEPKLIREIEKLHGVVIDVRKDLNQRQIMETNLTTRAYPQFVELVDEIIQKGTLT